MRMLPILLLIALCVVALPVLAAESTEALEKRVKDLEKGHLVLQEDLARTQLDLDTVKSALKKTRADLDAEVAARKALADSLAAEVAARKALEDRLAALDKKVDDQAAAQADFNRKSLEADAALGKRIDDLNKALSDLIAESAKQIAALRDALDKERADRQTAEAATKKYAKQSRTLTYVLSGALGGWVAASK